ncbi:MAG: NAD(P)-dependent oxidoreductase [Gemmatimonadetes bacterium]|jgi:3-hydroxyisobutyrate dehydrogenase-like beta-hydroxyacid dehydrogenase|nr:NAD(P)-dependent oxidoreductase [Gemmatimonadota bacterium]MBT4609575.1 NAD(P)-dependent oxidoreductase [Gemmatimonadota bacterium]MBT5055282.1 NAD(P)-dependent oxidoreductase [Gemmatimonadota bacterium]MBT5142848.1 NAD(P)-dependent oxidoreductase [Gemmatimonadota bacterium]MBT5589441.1 NAD(P)-dependent oxidoreductase [Gemmatimonadota bacterium]
MRIGFLHPGSMGVSLAASAKAAGHDACWASQGRSSQTRERADENGLTDVDTVQQLCEQCSAIVSICPPAITVDVSRQVAGSNFDGLYLDANAISPQRAKAIAGIVTKAGARYVDGGVIGGPAWTQDKTVLYLSGTHAGDVVDWFAGGMLATSVLNADPVAASALKMCYAAYTKGTSALLYGILGTAEAMGVRQALQKQWEEGDGVLAAKATGPASGVTSRAWRWIDEMQEISCTFEEAGLPGGFHAAASEIFRRLSDLRKESETTTEQVVEALLCEPSEGRS